MLPLNDGKVLSDRASNKMKNLEDIRSDDSDRVYTVAQ